MSRPITRVPRVIVVTNGTEVYAPWCDRCDSDARTRWNGLVWNAKTGELDYPGGALCLGCEWIISVTREEAHRALEPVRLKLRLAELKGAST